jgi:hypothetical protein
MPRWAAGPLLALALALAPAPATAATVSGYLPDTKKNFDYSFSTRPPAGIRIVAQRRDGTLDFRRRGRTLVRARMCEEWADSDPVDALKSEATSATPAARLRRVSRDLYRVGTEYWIPVRGGACLRFAQRPGGSDGLARRLAAGTEALLGRRIRIPASDPAGLALARRTSAAGKRIERITLRGVGGICSGRGMNCPRVPRPESVLIDAAFDRPARYVHSRASVDGAPSVTVVGRGSSEWVKLGSRECWVGPLPADDGDVFGEDDFGLGGASWRMRYGKPQLRPDGTTSVGFSGYWQRGVALIDASDVITQIQLVSREEPGVTSSMRFIAGFPPSIAQLSPEPICP